MLALIHCRSKNGWYANLVLEPEEWNEAKARAAGHLENAMAFFAPMFEDGPQRRAPGTVSSEYRAGSSKRSGAGSSTRRIAPPPDTENWAPPGPPPLYM